MTLAIVVGQDLGGLVTAVDVAASTVPASLARCIVGRVRGMRVPFGDAIAGRFDVRFWFYSNVYDGPTVSYGTGERPDPGY